MDEAGLGDLGRADSTAEPVISLEHTTLPSRLSQAEQPQTSELIPLPTTTASGSEAEPFGGDIDAGACALEERENGHPLSAFSTAAWSVASSRPGTARRDLDMRADDLVALALHLVHHDRARRPRAARAVPAFVSSPASDIVMQPPCAAASSSSGLVLPSACRSASAARTRARERTRAGRERARAARDVPFPGDLRSALDPRHQYSA